MADPDTYWTKLEAELDRLNKENEAEDSDPWASLDLPTPALTPQQRAALADQPRHPRLSGTAPLPDEQGAIAPDAPDSTGNAPGVPGDDLT